VTVERLRQVVGISIDRVAASAGADPQILRLENLDTDLRPPAAALAATREAVDDDDANSYLPFLGNAELREIVASHASRLSGVEYDANTQTVITTGGTVGLLNVLLATLNPGDEVILTDPTYVGMICRVRLAGAVPRLVPFSLSSGEWRLDLDRLVGAMSDRTRMIFVMNPSMPSGAVLNLDEWKAIADLCQRRQLWLLYNAAMERILYDQRTYLHPASLPGMAERTITVGSVSKEYRMIGWRVGWVVGPTRPMADVARVAIYNAVTPVGIAQRPAAAALRSPAADLQAAIGEWQRRRDFIVDDLRDYPLTRAAGGWSMLLDVAQLGYDSATASERLLRIGKIAATPMRDWGETNGDQFVRLVFSNEPVSRLRGIGDRIRAALGKAS
jgi:aspartate/methionine/tyrosine aminotransferase